MVTEGKKIIVVVVVIVVTVMPNTCGAMIKDSSLLSRMLR